MKIHLNVNQLLNNNFLLNKVNFSSRFGCYNNYYANLLNKKFMLVNLNYLLISLKKVIIITYKVGIFKGIFLSYISKSSIDEYEKFFIDPNDEILSDNIGLTYTKDDKNKAIKTITKIKKYSKYVKYFFYPNKEKRNFYLLFTNGLYGFLSNFSVVFLKHMVGRGKKQSTDYHRLLLPSLVFVTKNSYNEYYNFFRVFLKKRIICIRTFSLIEEVDINIGYNLSVNDCSKVYNLCRAIYKLVYIYNKKKW